MSKDVLYRIAHINFLYVLQTLWQACSAADSEQCKRRRVGMSFGCPMEGGQPDSSEGPQMELCTASAEQQRAFLKVLDIALCRCYVTQQGVMQRYVMCHQHPIRHCSVMCDSMEQVWRNTGRRQSIQGSFVLWKIASACSLAVVLMVKSAL